MNIALFGGAFNPPHIGHVLIARQVLDFTPTEKVWLLPNYKQTPPKPVASAEDRFCMTKFLGKKDILISTLEIDHKLDGETIHLLEHLPEGNTYTFVIGSDQLSSFHTWGRYEELLERLPFYVFPRYGYPNEPLYHNMKVIGHKHLIASNISSTKIRGRIKNNLSIKGFVPDGVEEYIKDKGLYR